MPRYSDERREAILKKLLPPYNRSVPEVAREEGVSEQTLYNWLKRCRSKGVPVPGTQRKTDSWSAEARFAVVVETAPLSEAELSQYCREKGLYPEQIKEWKAACIAGATAQPLQEQKEKQQRKADRKRIRQLERELRRKDKALAETAALLVLRKKLQALYAEEDEDS